MYLQRVCVEVHRAQADLPRTQPLISAQVMAGKLDACRRRRAG